MHGLTVGRRHPGGSITSFSPIPTNPQDVGCIMRTFKCTMCERILPLSEFYKSKIAKRGHEGKCKKCRYEQFKQWSKNNKDKIRANCIKYQEVNKDKIRERKKIYQKQYAQKHYIEYRQKIIEYQKQYAKKYPSKARARGIVKNHIKYGKIKRPTICSCCNRKDVIHAHHEDYSKPLEIIWLCASCHRLLHKREYL